MVKEIPEDYKIENVMEGYLRLDRFNERQLAEKLKKKIKIGEYNPRGIYLASEDFCDRYCKKSPYLNPMITCVDKCEIWELKDEILNLNPSERSSNPL